MVYLSQGLHKADQAKGVAVLGVLDILPAIIGGPFFTAVFFDPNSTQTGEHNAAGLDFVRRLEEQTNNSACWAAAAFYVAGLLFGVCTALVALGMPREPGGAAEREGSPTAAQPAALVAQA